MKVRVLVALASLLAVRATAVAQASFGLEATIGAQHLGIQRAPGMNEPLAPMGDLGATALIRAGSIALGAAAEGTFDGSTLRRYNASVIAGLVSDLLPVLRLELMGELGAANLRSAADLRAAASGEPGWTRFYGVRPGLSARIPVLPFRVGFWGLARWGLVGGKSGPEYGLLGRVGLEF